MSSDGKLTRIWAMLWLAWLGCSAPIASAQVPGTQQDIEALRELVRAFLVKNMTRPDEQAQIHVGRIDSRLRLTRCGKKIEVFLPSGDRKLGNFSVGVRCPDTRSWAVYVPVKVGVIGNVLVAARTLPRGHVLQAGDIRLESRDLARQHGGYFTDPDDAIGQSVRRPVTIGTVIAANAIKPARIIRRGEKVTILARHAGLEVRMSGVALADGAPGELVRVRNILSKKVIQGVITRNGEVRVKI